jgi:hypothetical protein
MRRFCKDGDRAVFEKFYGAVAAVVVAVVAVVPSWRREDRHRVRYYY